MRRSKLNARALFPAVFLMLAIDLIITAFTEKEYFRAQVTIPATILNSALTLGILWLLLRLSQSGLLAKWCHVILASLMAFSAGCTITRTEQFWRFTSNAMYSSMLIYGIFLAVLFYLLRSGMETTLRLVNLMLVPFLFSIGLLIAANLVQMQPENLIVRPFSMCEIIQSAQAGFCLSPVLLIPLVFAKGDRRRKMRSFSKIFGVIVILGTILSLLGEMVLGEQAAQQTLVFHSLSRLGRLSVFKRMDALHVWIWSMVEFSKAALYACTAQKSILLIRVDCKHPEIWAVGGVLLGVILANLCSEGWQQVIQSAGTAGLMVCLVAAAMRERRHHGAQNAV
ncbi:GerAB/ArcD/ProY family transporter [Owariibacterium komagatae]|uniref:GerAB/ArcD/ProY family transporter n=1 Tax=Owariibacterium komagatae TaxID=3136601 RepID=UPI0038B30D22